MFKWTATNIFNWPKNDDTFISSITRLSHSRLDLFSFCTTSRLQISYSVSMLSSSGTSSIVVRYEHFEIVLYSQVNVLPCDWIDLIISKSRLLLVERDCKIPTNLDSNWINSSYGQ